MICKLFWRWVSDETLRDEYEFLQKWSDLRHTGYPRYIRHAEDAHRKLRKYIIPEMERRGLR